MFILGKVMALLLYRWHKHDILFFIPHLKLSGAEIAHLDLIRSLRKLGKTVSVIVTTFPYYDLLKDYKIEADVVLLNRFINQKWLFFYFLGYYSTLINKRNEICIVGSHSYFFYRILSFIKSKKNLVVYDIIHNLEPGPKMRYGQLFNEVNVKIDHVLCVDSYTKQLIKQYSNRQHVTVLTNYTNTTFFTSYKKPLNVFKKAVFVGRNHPVKRVHFLEKISRKLSDNFEISWIGETEGRVKIPSINYYDKVNDRSLLAQILTEQSFLLITSSTEAFPMVIQEAMALGLVCICTDVGGISTHIKHLENGVLIHNSNDDNEIIQAFIYWLNYFSDNKSEYLKLSNSSRNYAMNHFTQKKFEEHVETLFGNCL